jgi:hypothetical protein
VAGLVLIGRSIVTRQITVCRVNISPFEIIFDADHWHEYPDKSLEVVDYDGEVIASFQPGHWTGVYYKDRLSRK